MFLNAISKSLFYVSITKTNVVWFMHNSHKKNERLLLWFDKVNK